MKGLHDDSSLYPILPGKSLDDSAVEMLETIGLNDPFRAAWEYVLTHRLSETERSAFWHGVGIQHRTGTGVDE